MIMAKNDLQMSITEQNIKLFDNFLFGNLSEEEKEQFENKLKADKDLASDFQLYSLVVEGVCREEQQDNLDFESAMKHLSEKQLLEIIGNNTSGKESPAKTPAVSVKWYRSWILQAACYVALISGAAIWIAKSDRDARHEIDNSIFAFSDVYESSNRESRSPSDDMDTEPETIDIQSMSEADLKANMPVLIKNYQSSTTDESRADNGYVLAMAYIRLHDRSKAREVLNELVARYDNNENFAAYVEKWKSILNLIK